MSPIERYIDDAVHHFERGHFASGMAYLASAKDEAARNPRIHIRTCDGWIAIYKNGRRVANQHSLWPHEVLEALGIEYTREDIDDKLNEWGDAFADGSEAFPEEL